MKTNELTYVMTEDEFKTALVAGAIRDNIIPVDLEGAIPSIQHVANGVILTFGPFPLVTKVVTSADKAAAVSVEPVTVHLPEGLSADEVKRVLSEVMERVPRINTIANWSEEQKQQAIDWARSNGKPHPRPSFIIEPAVRGSKKAQEPEVSKSEPPKRGRRPVVQIVSETYEKGNETTESELVKNVSKETVEEKLYEGEDEATGITPEPDESTFFEEDDGEPSEDPSL